MSARGFYKRGRVALLDEDGLRIVKPSWVVRRDFHVVAPYKSLAWILFDTIQFWQRRQRWLPVMWCEGYWEEYPYPGYVGMTEEDVWADHRWFGYEFPVSRRPDELNEPNCPYCQELVGLIRLCFGNVQLFNGMPFVQYVPYPVNKFRVHVGLLRYYSQTGHKGTVLLMKKRGIPTAQKPKGTTITRSEFRKLEREKRHERYLKGQPDPEEIDI